MVANNSLTGNYEDLSEIRQNRAPNTLDAILYQKGEDIPRHPRKYLHHLSNPENEFTDLFVDRIGNMSLSDTGRIENELVRQNVLYAVENSPFYQNKYKKALKLDSKEGLVGWVEENIQASDDLEMLPVLTNHDFKTASTGYSWGLMIPGKAEELKKMDTFVCNYQTGGTTGAGVASVIPYSEIDKQASAYEMLAGLVKYGGIEKGGKVLIVAPGQPHPFGPIVETALEKYSNTIHWKHFSPATTSAKIVDYIKLLGEQEGIDCIVGAPHGPKGAQASLDMLVQADEENGTDVFEDHLKGKNVVVGGSPTKRDFAIKLYDIFDKVTNQYGSAQFMGGNAPMREIWTDDDGLFSADAYKTRGYWSIRELKDSNAPEPWSRMKLTVLGRDILPIINYDPSDYVQITETPDGMLLKYICRVEFFKELPGGGYTIEIPSGIMSCVSGV